MKFGTKWDGVPIGAKSPKTYSGWGEQNSNVFSNLLLNWFDRSARNLPWRAVRDPYRVLLSELMLQQTQVATVIPYYNRFLEQWPTLHDLAAADDQAVLKAWEGLGYYSRARHLLAAVRAVVQEHNGLVPQSEKELLRLKGIGEYTAGAIRSIAFGLPAAAVDGNVVRVFSRLTATAWQPADPSDRRQVRALVEHLIPATRPGDFNEALMDLGATICLPQNPTCPSCPVQQTCQAFLTDTISAYPAKKPNREKSIEQLTCLIVTHQNQVHVHQRPDTGLLANLFEFDWLDESREQLLQTQQANCTDLGLRRHVFTHKIWQVQGFRIDLPNEADLATFSSDGTWVNSQELLSLPFPKVLIDWRDELVVALGRV